MRGRQSRSLEKERTAETKKDDEGKPNGRAHASGAGAVGKYGLRVHAGMG